MATTVDACISLMRSDPCNNPIDVIEGLSTALIFVNNLIDYPENRLYHRIRLSNINFKERIGHLRHSLTLLDTVGFTKDATDEDFVKVDESIDDVQSFVLRLRQARVSILTAKKEMQNDFWDFDRLSPDHKWVSVKSAGGCELQGRRPHMEDDHLLIDSFAGQDGEGLFCCFDGHGGREAVEFCIRSFPINLQRALLDTADRTMSERIASSFITTDAQMRRRSILESGATAAVCLICLESNQRVLYSANAGDARCVLVKSSDQISTLRISLDHKPNSEDETARINRAGGFVAGGRVNAILAVSRAFGDHHLKPAVTVEPYISRTVLGADDVAVIIACDGVWDVLSDQEAGEIVMQVLTNPDNSQLDKNQAQRAAEALAALAYDKGSQDNITAIVVEL